MFATKNVRSLIIFLLMALFAPFNFNLEAIEKKKCPSSSSIKTIIGVNKDEILALETIANLPPLPSSVKEIFPSAFPPSTKNISLLKSYRGEKNAKKASQIYQAPLAYGVSYLGPEERVEYLVRFGDNGRIYDYRGKLIDTSFSLHYDINRKKEGMTHAIFVLSPSGHMYLSTISEEGMFHHSTFLAGKEVIFAGEIKVIAGKIIFFNNASGHYQTPTDAHQKLLTFFKMLWKEKTPKIEFKEYIHKPISKY